MPSSDPYTSRLESNIALLTERLTWVEAEAGRLEADNEHLRRELDLAAQRVELAARERAERILAAAGERDAGRMHELEAQRRGLAARVGELEDEARSRIAEIRARAAALEAPVEPWRAPLVDPVGGHPPQGQGSRPDADLDSLLRLREALIEEIRATLVDFAERLAEAERGHVEAASRLWRPD